MNTEQLISKLKQEISRSDYQCAKDTLSMIRNSEASAASSYEVSRLSADVFTALGMYRDSIDCCNTLISINDRDLFAYCRLSDNHRHLGEYDIALAYAKEGLDSDSSDYALLAAARNACYSSHNFGSALEYSSLLVQNYPAEPLGYFFYAYDCIALRDYSRALQVIREGIAIQSNDDRLSRLLSYVSLIGEAEPSLHILVLSRLAPTRTITFEQINEGYEAIHNVFPHLKVFKHLLVDLNPIDELAWPPARGFLTENSDLLQSYNVHFGSSWNGFSALRNSCLAWLPLGDWIFMLDDDEQLLPGGWEAISRSILESHFFHDSIYLPRLNTYVEREDDLRVLPEYDFPNPNTYAYPDYQGRIFRNNGFIKYEGVVHEHLSCCYSSGYLRDRPAHIAHHKTLSMQVKSDSVWGEGVVFADDMFQHSSQDLSGVGNCQPPSNGGIKSTLVSRLKNLKAMCE